MVVKRKVRAKKARKPKKAGITARVKTAISKNPGFILGKSAYNRYQKLTPEQKAAVNKVLLELALLLI